ncbi:L,D-transpeptidase family protein [Blastochloris sulfoviridis]|nr:L,D-transpeptidase family protein [Blastochloris sulfoviridis]
MRGGSARFLAGAALAALLAYEAAATEGPALEGPATAATQAAPATATETAPGTDAAPAATAAPDGATGEGDPDEPAAEIDPDPEDDPEDEPALRSGADAEAEPGTAKSSTTKSDEVEAGESKPAEIKPELRPAAVEVPLAPAAAPAAATAPETAAPAAPSIDALVPVPEPANVPPPGLADIGPPAGAPVKDTARETVKDAVKETVKETAKDTEKDASPAVAPAGQAAREAAPPAPPPAAAAAVEDAAVTAALRALLAERGGSAEERRLRETLAQAYEARGFKPVWIEHGTLSARAAAVRTVLAGAATEGLDPADYPLPADPGQAATAATLASAELKYSNAAVTYARHAMSGRFDPGRVHPLVTPRRTVPKTEEVIAKVAQAADPGAALAAYNPPHDGYRALRTILAEMRSATAAEETARVPGGPLLRPGMRDARVPALRAKLGIAGEAADTLYGPDLVAAVEAFQETHDLAVDGVVGSRTLAALNGGGKATINDIIANMERWRWLPRDLGTTHIMVNIPEFTVRIWRNGQMIHRTRVITGKPSTPTPVFTDDMEYVVINPAWNVPPSIVRNEMLPLLASDPEAITRQGLEVLVNGRPVDPYEIYGADPNSISFRQPPGERNALGRIKFMFPNRHHVYLHDTPTRHLFAREVRTFSHGCIRVNEPLKFGEVVFSLGLPGEHWSPGRIESMFGRQENIIQFRQQFPVHVAYFTTMVDETGALVVRDDVYSYNAQVKALLGLEGEVRRFSPPPSARPVALPPPVVRPAGPPPTFLEQLFGIRPMRGG